MAKTARVLDLEPIDRLEEKVKLLLGLIERLRAEKTRLADDHDRLARELESARAQLKASEGAAAEMSALRAEREAVRARVAEMLEQIDSLNL